MTKNDSNISFSKNGHAHVLSNRIPFRWKELLVWTTTSFIFLIVVFGWLIGF